MNAIVPIKPKAVLRPMRNGGRWGRDEYDTAFLPAALEIVERPVSPTARITAKVMLVGVAATALWLTFGKVDVVAPAEGRIAPVGETKVVQAAETGIIRKILVAEGQRVQQGQVLIMLDPTVSSAEAAQVRAALLTSEFDIARNRAVLSGLDGKGFLFVAPESAPADAIETQRSLARARLNEIQAIAATGRSESGAAASASAEARAQVQKLQQSLPLLEQQVRANEVLAAKGYVSKLRVVDLRRQLISETQDLAAARAAVGRLAQQSQGTSSTTIKTREEARGQILQDLVKAEDDARARREELAKVTLRSSFRELRAPVSGTISQLSVHTEGGVVEGAKPLLTIVPENARLEVEVAIQNSDVGFVKTGMPVNVKLQAFPYTRYGTIPGKVIAISPEAVMVKEGQPPVFKARVSLSRVYIAVDGARVPLRPGMNASADLVTGKRSLLSYLISPIVETSGNALHER
ncbi:HlyD family type I secretion periplasmic adaptor subunit [Sphingomonas sp. JC676]|uniref:HlyD family type I secretion periplasmic adaptor subunit n=1 Tax=Sphingomonas sp. JC676 TaxID=2768065 RepID=UPI0016578631|nr:HlyD family type I secretion periplasmic adaptor subunit [Sphingomonas sp. JC676]MBC9032812.1 HlyD family type I secretion periplasmic adaptor subunit [Sphingomonas sp. JC676]